MYVVDAALLVGTLQITTGHRRRRSDELQTVIVECRIRRRLSKRRGHGITRNRMTGK